MEDDLAPPETDHLIMANNNRLTANGFSGPTRQRSKSNEMIPQDIPRLNEGVPGQSASTALLAPTISVDEVATAPTSPVSPIDPRVINLGGIDPMLSVSKNHLSQATSMTPTGSLLCINNTVQLRDSTLTVNYSDCGGEYFSSYFIPWV